MIQLKESQVKLIRAEARAAAPGECCGLLLGRRVEDKVVVDEVRPCRNLMAADRSDRFEIDPQERFDAMRHAKSMGRAIVGHYHSHPASPALPSATDRSMMYEPELVWLIAGGDGVITAWRPNLEKQDFDAIDLVIQPGGGEN